MVHWDDREDEIIGGDLTAALGYVTPAGGVVVCAVAPIGLRRREAGTVSFTTSLGFGRKLARIRANPNVALAFHAREHGFAHLTEYVLVQGRASFDTTPDRQLIEGTIGPASERFLGAPRRGLFWDAWLREYYADRVVVAVEVERVVSFPDLAAAGPPHVTGPELELGTTAPQAAPAKGAGPRVDVARVSRRAARLAHVLLGYVGPDGRPVVIPVAVAGGSPAGVRLVAAPGLLAPGGRRAGLLAHRYEAQLVGLESRQYTGWLDVGHDGEALYAPQTEAGFRAPANKTLLLLANGLMAKRGLRRARRAA